MSFAWAENPKNTKATRAATRLGLRLLPDDLQGEVGDAIVSLFEKELGALLEKAL